MNRGLHQRGKPEHERTTDCRTACRSGRRWRSRPCSEPRHKLRCSRHRRSKPFSSRRAPAASRGCAGERSAASTTMRWCCPGPRRSARRPIGRTLRNATGATAAASRSCCMGCGRSSSVAIPSTARRRSVLSYRRARSTGCPTSCRAGTSTIHEYRKHGVCSGLDPDGYYTLCAAAIRQGQGPPAASMRQTRTRSSILGPWSMSSWRPTRGCARRCSPWCAAVPATGCARCVCAATQNGEFRACGGNENPRRLCAAPRVYVPPVRASRGEAPRGRGPSQGPMLPGPVPPSGTRAL